MRLHSLRRHAVPSWFAPCLLAVLLALSWWAKSAAAEAGGQSLQADGMVIYYGVLPAALVSPDVLQERGTHMTVHNAKRPGSHHVVIALFDAASGERIAKARVQARIAPLGGSPVEKPLEAMNINGTVTFGNFFRMDGDMPYAIQLRIRRQGSDHDTEARVTYRHPSR